LFLAKNTS